MKKIYIVIGIVVILIIVAFWNKGPVEENLEAALSYKDATYIIDGKSVTLKNGLSEVEIPDSSAKTTTSYFGNEVKKDLDGDGKEDVVFLLTQQTGGRGTFFFVVAALNTENGS